MGRALTGEFFTETCVDAAVTSTAGGWWRTRCTQDGVGQVYTGRVVHTWVQEQAGGDRHGSRRRSLSGV